ncbi:glutaredoxin family protein [Mycolicibacterium goodii]|uniref:glutaredoxin family protein n=1 Tax=Mycolicibacterium goodii TaxID=134601 RepID=UPI001BDC0563|nr:glutaredoxin family protein [Mycolicibacterium goodii]MBU8833630.1 glutaredoxin family protein [Mycolicibacterium goodii]
MSVIVAVYTQPACPQCTATKKALDKLGIAYSVEEITDQIRDAAIELDITSAPIVCANVDGVELEPWGGFRPDRIDALRGAT